jgi:hypothetical protein
MGGETQQPEPRRPRESSEHGSQPEDAGAARTERVGPLALERQRKQDGRALLLYALRGGTR